MSIQGSFNSSLIGVAVVASLAKINQSINELGYNDYKELCGAISNLEIEIAKKEDEGKPSKKLKTLLNKYLEVRQSYDEAIEKQRQEEKSRRTKAVIIFSVFCVIVTIILITIILNLNGNIGERYVCPICSANRVTFNASYFDEYGNNMSGSENYKKANCTYRNVRCQNCGWDGYINVKNKKLCQLSWSYGHFSVSYI